MLMDKNRLEAFSDGVIAVIITIMALEMKVPHRPDFGSLSPLLPVFPTYVVSFAYVSIEGVTGGDISAIFTKPDLNRPLLLRQMSPIGNVDVGQLMAARRNSPTSAFLARRCRLSAEPEGSEGHKIRKTHWPSAGDHNAMSGRALGRRAAPSLI